MEMEDQSKSRENKALLILNCMLLSLGNCGGPLIMRLYFLHGGQRVWLSCWLQTIAWPFMLIPISIDYYRRRRTNVSGGGTKFFQMKPSLFLPAAVIGVLTGLDDFIYAYGVARLPISTSALIIASQLAFTALFAFLLVRQKLTPYSLNAVVLLTIGGAVLAMHTSSDRPKGESNKEYMIGFWLTVATSVLYGFVLPLTELTYKRAKQTITYLLVLEIQTVLCLFATLFCTVGMLVNKDFQAIREEARDFGLGEAKYYMVLIGTAIFWQAFFLGAIGVVFCASSLLSGILIAVLLPVTEVLAVVFYDESFKVEKGISLVLSLWGFVSYFYGEMKYYHRKKEEEQSSDIQMPQLVVDP
ncbi:hypothetical protein FNV43_RR11151 [Rhamnella rubrinervis]|uniref:Probable purine permease n=1 Tax=Rhamnella rubrinervis TaxID=2594499 RepID=A0A8K0H5F8_9ROSA|nr:hypothetical protein FNV43_RR11151 [Rhamnella rubrinervis]